MRVRNPKRSLSVAETQRSKQQSSISIHEKTEEIHYNPVASGLSKLHSDPTFSITLFSPLGPQAGSGAIPRLWQLRETPGPDALFYIVLSPGPFVFFGPFHACVLSVLVMSFCAFGALYLIESHLSHNYSETTLPQTSNKSG